MEDSMVSQYREKVCRSNDSRPCSLPSETLVMYPSWSGKYSFRESESASWLENTLNTTVEDLGRSFKSVSVVDLFTEVAKRISIKETGKVDTPSSENSDMVPDGCKSTVALVYNLTQDVIFHFNSETDGGNRE